MATRMHNCGVNNGPKSNSAIDSILMAEGHCLMATLQASGSAWTCWITIRVKNCNNSFLLKPLLHQVIGICIACENNKAISS